MRAVIAYGAGDLRISDVHAQPLGDGEVEVAIEVGGICGSDLHYYHRGGVGDFKICEPLVLGHEVAGVISGLGNGVVGLGVGERVAVDPSRPCGRCTRCSEGRRNLCTDMRFLGSAARTPHWQGGFRDRLVVSAEQCVPLPKSLALRHAVLAEPLAVALHAVDRAGSLLSRDVVVVGSGPIGVLIAVVAARGGAASVTVADVLEEPLAVAVQLGATRTVNLVDGDSPPAADVVFEASGAPVALETCLSAVEPGGVVVLVGLQPPGNVPVPVNQAVGREIDVRGSFRFVPAEFRAAVRVLAGGLDLSALVTHRFKVDEAFEAFEAASMRNRSMKVHLDFDGL